MIGQRNERAGRRGARAVILTGAAHDHPGGLSMRWRALQTALDRQLPCTLQQLGCDRWDRCQAGCRLTGRLGGAAEVAMLDDVQVWHADRTYCPEYVRRLAGELVAARVTTVVCSGLDTHRYVTALAALGWFTVVFDLHNVEAQLHQAIQAALPAGSPMAGFYSERHVRLVDAAERTAVRAADAVWVCSDEDRAEVIRRYAVAPDTVRVMPNVVEVTGAAPPPAGARSVCFTGRMDWYPNIEAGLELLLQIAPRLRKRGHQLPVVVAGAMAQEMLGDVELAPGVELISDPPSPAALIAGSIMAVPLKLGGGSRFKILEAFAGGAPVISTAKGAEGLGVVPGEHYLAAEEPDEFVDAVDRLIGDPALRTQLTQAAWTLLTERYSLDALTARLADLAVPVPAR
ncbi:glycosyltransferase [Micromonospora sp. KC606]|uniref:glycosyltransferase family 4 protein n=1 Tax=Micromonospora sp. KC606 TaxID=2530379 RepID=UPI001043C327|nr:glycosyltransferase family 4 protein [Micromonospora sp. KC606]TDC72450.1 glycosyltransferase [Micromonospora sp. KC606]